MIQVMCIETQNLEHLLKYLQVYLSKGNQNTSENILALLCPFLLVKGEE